MSSSKNVDLKCSETLRDSPPPAPPPPSHHQQSQLQLASVFASNNATPQQQQLQNLPGHHQPIHVPTLSTVTAFSQFTPQQQSTSAPTVSLFVRKFDGGQRGIIDGGVGRNSMSESSAKIGNTAGSSLPFGIANVVSAVKSSSSSHVPQIPQSASLYSQQQPTHGFAGFPLATAPTSIWPLVQQHAAPLPLHLPTASSKPSIFASTSTSSVLSSPSKLQPSAASATLPLSLSPSKASGGSGQTRPLTLHVSTSRGPAVFQLQHSTTTSGSASTSGKQSVKLLPASTGLASPSSHQSTHLATGPSRPASGSIVTGMVQTRVPVLRPSPVHPMAAATAAILSQLAPNAPGFGLGDQHGHHMQHQHLQAAAALLRSPLTTAGAGVGGSIIPHVVSVTPQQMPSQVSTAGGRTVIVSVSGSHYLAGAGSLTSVASGDSGTPTKNFGTTPLTPTNVSTATNTAPVTPSPTRPSILRKRVLDLANGANTGSSSPAKRLAYEPVALAKRANEKGASTPDSDSRPGTSMASTISSVVIEHPEAGNSNQSSSASTISAGSAPDNGNGHSANSSQTSRTGMGSPSPRKRPRKQQLSELTAPRGYGSDDEVATPVLTSYHCEPIEEETVMGPTGVGGLDDRYLAGSSTGSLFLPTVQFDQGSAVGDLYDQYQNAKRSGKSDYAASIGFLASQRQSHYERPSTSFDQLQQQIEQQRKHIPEYRPRPSLLAQYELAYDSKRYHFAVQDDVRARDEKRPSMIELSNQKQIWQRIGGWKTHLMSVQFDNLDRDEKSNLDDLNELYSLLSNADDDEEDDESKELETVREMVLTNVQRVRVIREHLDDGKKQLMALLKHKTNVEKLIQKYTTKRPTRKKDRGKNGVNVSEL